jgi:hypothetical protein
MAAFRVCPEVELLAVYDVHKPSIAEQLKRFTATQSNTNCKGTIA